MSDGASTGRGAEIYAWSKTLSEQTVFPSSILNNTLLFKEFSNHNTILNTKQQL